MTAKYADKPAGQGAVSDAHQAVCPGCGARYYLRRSDLGRRSTCRRCGQVFYLLPPSGEPPTAILQEDSGPAGGSSRLVGRLWLNLRPGQIVADDFLVIRPLARGGLSQIFKVRDLRRNIDLALKLPLASTLDRLPRKAFVNEALAWLKPAPHPNLVTCDQVRLIRGQPVIFMEYVDGDDLSRLASGGRGSLYREAPRSSCVRLLDIFIQAARGLGYAHTLGLTNLDLKPRNVLVGLDGRVRIGDYGPLSDGAAFAPDLAGDHDQGPGEEETRISGTRLLGTPQYFSPEAAAGTPGAGASSDLWALALTVLECFLGRRPWEMGSVVGQALEQYLARPGHPTYLPPALAAYFKTALAADPADRWPDAESVAQRLSDIYREITGRPYERPPARPEKETPERLARKNASLKALGRGAPHPD